MRYRVAKRRGGLWGIYIWDKQTNSWCYIDSNTRWDNALELAIWKSGQ